MQALMFAYMIDLYRNVYTINVCIFYVEVSNGYMVRICCTCMKTVTEEGIHSTLASSLPLETFVDHSWSAFHQLYVDKENTPEDILLYVHTY